MVYTPTTDDDGLFVSSDEGSVAAAPREAMSAVHGVRNAAAGVAIALTLGFVLWRLRSSASGIDVAVMREHIAMICAALALFSVGTLLLAAVWIVLLEDVSGVGGRRSELTIAFTYAWLARYVPGTLPYLAGKVYLGGRLGYATRPLVLATTLEAAVSISVPALFGAALLAIAERDALGYAATGGIAASALAACAILLQPRFLRGALGPMLRLVRRPALGQDALPSARTMTVAAMLVVGNQTLNGIGVLALAHATAGATWADLPLVAAALSLAGAAAMLVVLAPAGLGVRDGAMTTILASRFAVDAAALVAVLMRAVSVVGDVMLALGALVYDVVAGKRVLARALTRPQTVARAVPSSPQLAEERAA